MSGYRFSRSALKEFWGIVNWLHRRSSAGQAMFLENEIWRACEELVQLTALGHRRDDLCSRPVLFHQIHGYFLIFDRRKSGVYILAVVRASRDVAAVLRRKGL